MTWAQGDGDTVPIGEDYFSGYYFGKEKKFVRFDADDKDVKHVNNLLWSLCDLDPEVVKNDKRTLKQYLIDNGVNEKGLALADTGYANTICSNLDKLRLYEVVLLEKAWLADGDGDYRMDNCMAQVPEYMSHGLDIRKNWPVKFIDYSLPDRIILRNDRGDVIEASRVVITASPPAIDRHITFVPQLPILRKVAIQSVKLENTIKIYLKFTERFWPEKLQGVIITDSVIPEIFFNGPERTGILQHGLPGMKAEPQTPYYAVGFVCASYADYVASLGDKKAFEEMLDILDNMTRGLPEAKGHEKPAHHYFIGGAMHQWAHNPYVLGGYSTGSVPIENRRMLAQPIQNRLFFAGEATNESFMTVHGALQSGKRASQEVLQSLLLTARL